MSNNYLNRQSVVITKNATAEMQDYKFYIKSLDVVQIAANIIYLFDIMSLITCQLINKVYKLIMKLCMIYNIKSISCIITIKDQNHKN